MITTIASFLWWVGSGYIKSKIWNVFIITVDGLVHEVYMKPKHSLRLGYRYTEKNLLDYFNELML